MRVIENKVFDEERALYNESNLKIQSCKFEGPADGESALKECSTITVNNTLFDLRYPLWHCKDIDIFDSEFTINARAAIWYATGIDVSDSYLYGIKAIRECDKVNIARTCIRSPEFGWRTNNISFDTAMIISEYFMFESKNVILNNVKFKGKYSFQYVENLEIYDSFLDTKDAFWHAKHVLVKNSVVVGEYLGWYSSDLTFIDCTIIGTQPLCYCKKLNLINCKMIDTDLSFEYSDVNAEIIGEIKSVKNPLRGRVIADSFGEIITENNKFKSKTKCYIGKRINK